MRNTLLNVMLWGLFLAGSICFLSGCKTMTAQDSADRDEPSSLPWNAPASWEGQVLGIPY